MVAVVLGLSIALLNGVVIKGTMSFLNKSFAAVNDEMDPFSADHLLRSGGPGSLVSWNTLGNQGRIFVAGGPKVEQPTKFNGAPAVEPIRAYAGKNLPPTSGPPPNWLRRTGTHGGFSARSSRSRRRRHRLDQRGRGLGAGVHVQRRLGDRVHAVPFLPSWLSFLVDKENARQAGQARCSRRSTRRVRALPEGQRPKVVVFGESLVRSAAKRRS